MRRIWAVLLVAATVATFLVVTKPADAAVPQSCNLAATTTIVRNQVTTKYVWTIAGKGTCTDSNSTYLADLSASGTSDTLGICTDSDVKNLDLNAVLTTTSTTTGIAKATTLNIGAPTTTYPVTTPFVAKSAGAVVGGGTIFTHVFLACPPLGTPSTAIYLELAR